MDRYEKQEAEKNAIDITRYNKEKIIQINFKSICILLLIIIIVLILYFNNVFYKFTYVTEKNIDNIIISEKLNEDEKIKIIFKIFKNENIYNKFLFQILK